MGYFLKNLPKELSKSDQADHTVSKIISPVFVSHIQVTWSYNCDRKLQTLVSAAEGDLGIT